MDVSTQRIENGFRLSYKKRKYSVRYPHHIWKSAPPRMKSFVIDNVSFLSTAHLPLVLGAREFSYRTSPPAFRSHYRRLLHGYLPYVADADSRPMREMLAQSRRIRYRFPEKEPVRMDFHADPGDRAVVSFTFGKDSLLSYCVANEAGLDPIPVYVEEPEPKNSFENLHKRVLIRSFEEEFGRKVVKFRNDTSLLRDHSHLKARPTELGWTHQLTEYFIELLPVCHRYKARFMVFGNEQSCNDFYRSSEGRKCFPAYDQTSEWTLNLGRMARSLDKRLHVMSLVEPLHEIAITRVLHNRYRDHAKYHTSCFADKQKGKENRWCHLCTKCGRMYAFFRANNISPSKVGFKRNLFEKQFSNYYTLFGNGKSRSSVPYDSSGLGRDEQLLAFYLAYKNGSKGYLINRFRKELLPEARGKEDELHRKFFRIHRPLTMPKEIRKNVMPIYREELGG